MKLTAFVLGGLAGAAVAMILRNQAVTTMAGSVGQMVRQRIGDAKDTAIGRTIQGGIGSGFISTLGKKGRHESRSDASPSRGLGEVERLASLDPEVKSKVNEILDDNGHRQI